jgi:hypothetical protein
VRQHSDLLYARVVNRDMSIPATPLIEPAAGLESSLKQNSAIGFRVAELQVEMRSAPGGPALAVPASLRPFVAETGSAGITLEVDWAEEIAAPREAPIFDSGGVWTLHRGGLRHEFVFRSPATGEAPYKLASMEEGFRRGRVWLSRRVFGARQDVYPLEYPLDELLVIHRLSRGEGVEVHACGVMDDGGRGLLFPGHSGAGKSTLARLWLDTGRGRILSDDRIILRRNARGAITMHGTPWHGEARLALPLAARLDGVFLLEHARGVNEIQALAAGRAAAELMARSFLPFHDAAGLAFSLQFFAELSAEVPVNIFRFLPDATAIREMENRA